MYRCESWTLNKAEHWRIDAFELWCSRRLLRVPWLQGDQPIHPKGDQFWVFIGRTDVEAETPILGHLIQRVDSLEKTLMLGGIGQEEKGKTEDEMAGWYHWLDAHGFGWTLGVGDGQGGLACCNSWSHKELDMTERLNWTESLLIGLWVCILFYTMFFSYIQLDY